MKVIYIRDSKSRGYLRIGVATGEEKTEYTLSEKEYRGELSLLVGDEVSEEQLLLLSEYDMKYRARLAALRILSYGDNNEKNICQKLTKKGIRAEIARETAREMVGLGYINERRQLERLVEKEVARELRGPRAVYMRLMKKGYSKKDIYEVISDLISHGIIDFEKSKQNLIEKKLPAGSGEEDIKKLLYKFGY
ncbi:MAG: RecX family transcriptional regulator [Clostridia bacterium]|nr:RecX family transcriptional regulator [Clostridia bacterium]